MVAWKEQLMVCMMAVQKVPLMVAQMDYLTVVPWVVAMVQNSV